MQWFERLMAAVPDAIIVTGLDGTIEQVNAAAVELFGHGPWELIGRPIGAFLPPPGDGSRARPARAWPEGFCDGSEIVVRRRDGSEAAVEFTTRRLTMPEGDRVIACARDVSAARAAAAELRNSELRFRLAFEEAPIGMALVGLHGLRAARLMRVNRALCTLTGYAEDALVEHSFPRLVHPEDEAEAARRFATLASGEAPRLDTECRYRRADGRELWVQVSAAVAHDPDGLPAYAVTQIVDITDRRRAEAQLTHRALHDALTNLPNRALLMDHLAAALERVTRSRRHLAVLFLDLDEFKSINDSLGHAAGDEVLAEVARRLLLCLRGRDIVARLGGDEFVIVCEELAHPAEVDTVVGRLERALRAPLHLGAETLHLTTSIGVAVADSTRTPEGLLQEADAAMYRAKARGKAGFAVADGELQTITARRRAMVGQLRTALAEGQLRLDYQPCVDLETGVVTEVEALLRWDHPEAGVLLAGEFLEVVAREDLVDPIGDFVIGEACRQAGRWHADVGPGCPHVWINVTVAQFGRRRVSRMLVEACARASIPVDQIGLELPETQASLASPAVRSELHALRGTGVRLAIDDFRIARGGIDYLRDLPIDHLKLDRSLTVGLGQDRADTAVARTAATLATALDAQLVAKGIETAGQRERVTDLGCALGQGYLLGPPRPAEQLTPLLA